MSTVQDALQALTDLTPSRQQILADAVAGLSRASRQLPSKYFYDARGSRLFEQITQTREYYPTRTELALLARVLPDIARVVGPRLHVVELGSGSGRKTALLLAALQDPVAYTPIEISRAALLSSIDHLAPALPEVEMLPVCADFTRAVAVPTPERTPARRHAACCSSPVPHWAISPKRMPSPCCVRCARRWAATAWPWSASTCTRIRR